MDFAEVNRRYEDLKQQYQAGTLSADQFDDQLLEMMVRDDTNRWWAKARESGDWHYHDAGSGEWVRADPPGTRPTVIPPATSTAKASPTQASAPTTHAQAPAPKTASTQPASSQAAAARSAGASQPTGAQTPASTRPTWAAVVPPAAATIMAQPPAEVTHAGSTGPQSQSTAPHAGIDFGPLPELSGALKVLFYLLAFFIPLVGIILFFVYRHKPAAQDRSAARVFLILGIVSLLLSGLCGATLVFADMLVASLLQY